VSGKHFGQFPEYENVQQAILEQINTGARNERQLVSKSSLNREDTGEGNLDSKINQIRSPKIKDVKYQSFKSQQIQNQSVRSPSTKNRAEKAESDLINIKLLNQNGDNYKIQTQTSQHNQSGRGSDHKQKAGAKSVKSVNSKQI